MAEVLRVVEPVYAKIKDGWYNEGRRCQIIGPSLEIYGIKWTPVLYEDAEDPDWHKSEGLQILKGLNNMKGEWRKVEKRINGVWGTTEFEQLLPGDVFRLFDADGTPVTDGKGKTIFKCLSHPVPDTTSVPGLEGNYRVEMEPTEE